MADWASNTTCNSPSRPRTASASQSRAACGRVEPPAPAGAARQPDRVHQVVAVDEKDHAFTLMQLAFR